MNTFEDAMGNVRAAFRLLYAFNERIISLMKYIEKAFDMSLVGENSYCGGLPLRGKININKKRGWSWLPLYYYEFCFAKENIQMSVFLQCDTGSWEGEVDWDEVDSYSGIQESKTKLLFAIRKDEENSTCFGTEEDFASMLGEEDEVTSADGKRFYKSFDLVRFKDENETIRALKEFVAFAKEQGVRDIDFIDN